MAVRSAELVVSNICWQGQWGAPDDPLSRVALETLQAQHPPIRSLDIAPTKVFEGITRFGPDSVTDEDISAFQGELAQHDLTVRGFQSLTFQRSENMFGNSEEQRTLSD